MTQRSANIQVSSYPHSVAIELRASLPQASRLLQNEAACKQGNTDDNTILHSSSSEIVCLQGDTDFILKHGQVSRLSGVKRGVKAHRNVCKRENGHCLARSATRDIPRFLLVMDSLPVRLPFLLKSMEGATRITIDLNTQKHDLIR